MDGQEQAEPFPMATPKLDYGQSKDKPNKSGQTGFGDWTLMSQSLSQRETLSCRHERIVLIEGTGEIQIQKENVLRFEARREQNDLPSVTIRDLLKATLRHRPVQNYCWGNSWRRGVRPLAMLNTGHSERSRRVHANSAAQGISRFTTCVLQSGIEMPYRAIKTNIADSLNLVIQIERRPGDTLHH